MPLTVDAFKSLLLTAPLEDIAREHLLTGPSYAFRNTPHAEELLFDHLCDRLALTRSDLAITGSGKLGFSLNPSRFPRSFNDTSDIDIIVVNAEMFDTIWFTIITWNYPWRFRLLDIDWKWARSRRDDIFWGWFRPDAIRYDGISFPSKLRQLRDMSANWFNAFQSLSIHTELGGRQISGRLYRTWHHALLYHVEGLRQIVQAVQGKGTH